MVRNAENFRNSKSKIRIPKSKIKTWRRREKFFME